MVMRSSDCKSVCRRIQGDMAATLTALRAYDPDAVSAAFDTQAQNLTARLILGDTEIRDFLLVR